MATKNTPKVFKLKKWLTIEAAAQHLSGALDEAVSEADLLRFALDGHLTLSVRLINGAFAKPGKLVPADSVERRIQPTLDGKGTLELIDGYDLNNGQVLQFEHRIMRADGVWDLPMFGGERLDVEHRYQLLTRGPEVTDIFVDGTFLKNGDLYCQLQIPKSNLKTPYHHPDNYYPAGALPEDAVLVVRTDCLFDLLRSLEGDTGNPQVVLGKRERDTLLVIIAALMRMNRMDWKQPSKAAAVIETATMELKADVASRTIENHLNRIPTALEDRRS